MSTMTSINILLLAFIVGCAFVRADPVANPECKAVDAPTAAIPVFAAALVKINGMITLVIDLCTQLKLNIGLNLVLSICIRIAAYVKTMSGTYSESCKQMKTTDIQGLFLSLKVSNQAILSILGKCKTINVMVIASVDVCIGLLAILDIYLSLALQIMDLALSVDLGLSVYLQTCIDLGLKIYASIFAQVVVVLQICVQLSLGVTVSVNVTGLLNLILTIAAGIQAAITLGIKVAVGLCLNVSTIPKPCKDIAITCGNQVTAIVNATLSLTAGTTISVSAIVQIVLGLFSQIKAALQIKAEAIVTVVLTLSVQALSKTCDCYQKTGSGMMKSPYKIRQPGIDLSVAVNGLLGLFAKIGLGIL